MSKAVLISIRPEWCNLIVRGKKTVEVRKTSPKLETPFKVYIYCTRSEDWRVKLPKIGMEKVNGKVIGEFTCDKIDKLVHVGTMMDINILTLDGWYKPADALLQAACLAEAQAKKYLKGGDGYGWNISDLKIYDQPRKFVDFLPNCRFGEDGECEYRRVYCEHQNYDYNPDGSVNVVRCDKRVQKAPQSWCYVEEKDIVDLLYSNKEENNV